MADNLEDLASRLREFVHAVKKKEPTGQTQAEYRGSIAEPRSDPTLRIYKVCVRKLAAEDHVHLARILKEMSDIVAQWP
jgi:hypothetical protein